MVLWVSWRWCREGAVDPSTLMKSGLKSAYYCVEKVKLHGWWVYVYAHSWWILPCNWGNDDGPCEEELGAGCSELRSDPCLSTLPFLSPKLVSRDALRFPHFTHAVYPHALPKLLLHFHVSTVTNLSFAAIDHQANLVIHSLCKNTWIISRMSFHFLLMSSYLKSLCKDFLSRTYSRVWQST